MSKIVILDEKTANQIAAGEVIERPASVVKELVENSIDAGADQIAIEIKNGGISYIRISDNGSGMEADDVEIAFERHATSKIRKIEDLDGLSTMGFRGEALASVASVSHLEVVTKTEEAAHGINLKMEGGRVISLTQTGCPKGTSFTIRNLFYNTPARYKFLKKDTTEAGYVSDIMERMALAHPEISFKYIQNNQVQMHTPGNHDLISTIYSIYGKDIARAVLPVAYESEGISVTGFIGKPEIARGTRNSQSVFLNGRYIKSRMIANALEEAYKTILMQNKFPFCVLLLNAAPGSFDVNVHPQKLEVRFSNESSVYSAVFHGVKSTLLETSLIRDYNLPKDNRSEIKKDINPPIQTTFSELTGVKAVPLDRSPFEVKVQPYSEAKPPNIDAPEKAKPVVLAARENDSPASSLPYYEVREAAASILEPVEITKDKSVQELLEAELVGQAFDTYIMLENGDNLYVIDQHAAHERIRYETLKKRLANDESFSQMVMEPIIVKLSGKEYDFVMEKQYAFSKLGFDLESFGSDTVILRSIPDIYDSGFGMSDFHQILDRWIQSNSTDSAISDETIFMMSCKSAIKANRPMSKEEIKGLVDSLCKMENPFTCVHGRPVIINLGKKELEKKFKRIV